MKIIFSRKDLFLMTFVVTIGALLRFMLLGRQCIWADEAITYQRISLPISALLSPYNLGINPPAYFILIKLWTHLFGLNIVTLRAFSAFMGSVGVLLTYIAGRNIFNIKTGLVSALLIALLPMHIYFSQEARSYAMLIAFILFSFIFFKNVIDRPDKFYNFLILALSQIALAYTHYAGFSIIAIEIIFLFISTRKQSRYFVKYILVLVLAFLPWIKSLFFHTHMLSINWKGRGFPGITELFVFLKEFANTDILISLLLWSAFISLLLYKPFYSSSTKVKVVNYQKIVLMLFFCSLIPIIIVILCAEWFKFPFKVKYALSGLPSFLILASYGMMRFFKREITTYFVLFLIAMLMAPSLYAYYHTNYNQDWRPVVNILKDYWMPGQTKLIVNLKDGGKVLKYYTADFIDASEFPRESFFMLRRRMPDFSGTGKNIKCILFINDQPGMEEEIRDQYGSFLLSSFPDMHYLSLGSNVGISFYCSGPLKSEELSQDYSIIPAENTIWK